MTEFKRGDKVTIEGWDDTVYTYLNSGNKGSSSVELGHIYFVATDRLRLVERVEDTVTKIVPTDILTPAQKLGYKVGDKFKIVSEGGHRFKLGTTVTLLEDDGTEALRFKDDTGVEQWCKLIRVAPLKKKITPTDKLTIEITYSEAAMIYALTGMVRDNHGIPLAQRLRELLYDEDDAIFHQFIPKHIPYIHYGDVKQDFEAALFGIDLEKEKKIKETKDKIAQLQTELKELES